MEYRAVGNRCAVNFATLNLPIPTEEALALLQQKQFRVLEVDMLQLARYCIGVSKYCRGARFCQAPGVVDCSSLIKWLYGQRGIWLPRRTIQQRKIGEVVLLEALSTGDVVFVSGWINYYCHDPKSGVGHVGVATGWGTIIHAADADAGIVETPVEKFIRAEKFRGARRYIPKDQKVFTLEIPPNRDVETADDIKWIILQSLPKTSNNHV